MPAASGTSLNRNSQQYTGEYAPGGNASIRKTLTFSAAVASAVNQVIGTLPAGAKIFSGEIVTTTAFNGTTPTLAIGYAADSAGAAVANAYASALALPAALTQVAFGAPLLTATAAPRPVATTLTAAITYTNTTAGSCDILINYVNG